MTPEAADIDDSIKSKRIRVSFEKGLTLRTPVRPVERPMVCSMEVEAAPDLVALGNAERLLSLCTELVEAVLVPRNTLPFLRFNTPTRIGSPNSVAALLKTTQSIAKRHSW